MESLPVHILEMVTRHLGDREWASASSVSKDMQEACSATFASRREEFEIDGRYLKNILRGMFPELHDDKFGINHLSTYMNNHEFGTDVLGLQEHLMHLVVCRNEASSKIFKDVIEPLMVRMFPTSNINIYSRLKNGMPFICMNVWMSTPLGFTAL
jgi:hypothetical protein